MLVTEQIYDVINCLVLNVILFVKLEILHKFEEDIFL